MWDSNEFDAKVQRAARHGWRITACQAARYVLVLRRGGRHYFVSAWRMGKWSK
jgi:hypothetical protein